MQVGFRAAVHLSFDHLESVAVAFDGTGALGDGEPGGDGGPVLAEASAETAQLADRAGLSVAGPCFQTLAAAVAEHVGELADQIAGRFELFAAGGDLREVGTVVVGEVAGRGEDPTGRLVGRRCWRRRGDGGVAAQLGGEPAQGAQAAAVAAVAQFGMQLLGAAAAFVPSRRLARPSCRREPGARPPG